MADHKIECIKDELKGTELRCACDICEPPNLRGMSIDCGIMYDACTGERG